jgi:predicted transcriptional regulator
MTRAQPALQGALQRQVMKAMWSLRRASVDEVRRALPARQRGAYTTVQTILNRLAERGLLRRERSGNLILYAPRLSEADYLASSMQQTLAGASNEARRVALADLVGELSSAELEEVQDLAAEVRRRRRGRGR